MRIGLGVRFEVCMGAITLLRLEVSSTTPSTSIACEAMVMVEFGIERCGVGREMIVIPNWRKVLRKLTRLRGGCDSEIKSLAISASTASSWR